MNQLFWKAAQLFWCKLPFVRIMQTVDLLFFSFESRLGFSIFSFEGLLLCDQFRKPIELVSNIFEESIEIFLQKLMLIPSKITPLDHHIVKGHKNIVDSRNLLTFGKPICSLSSQFVEISKHVSHFIEGIYLVGHDQLQFFASSCDLFV